MVRNPSGAWHPGSGVVPRYILLMEEFPTLQGTNISPAKALLKMMVFLFPRWDMYPFPERYMSQNQNDSIS